MNKKIVSTNLIYAALFIVLIAVDRFTKKFAVNHLMESDMDVIPNVLSLHYLENRGAAWGILQNAFWLFLLITIVVVGIMIFLYARIPFEKHYLYLRFTIILLTAGAIGNFIDRAFWHYVVDFIYFKWINFPVFNVADIYVCVSAFLLIHCLLFIYKDEEIIWKKNS